MSGDEKEKPGSSKSRSARADIAAPLIACGIAAAVMLFLMLPGVLSYPGDDLTGRAEETDEALEIVREHNAMMKERIDALRGALDAGLCLADGDFTLPDGDLSDSMLDALPSTPIARAPVCAGAGGGETVRELIDDVTVYVAMVDDVPEQGLTIVGHGTGFFIREGEIVTNAHVVLDKESGEVVHDIVVYGSTFGRVPAEVIAVGRLNEGGTDLAVLRVPPVEVSTAVFAEASGDGMRVRSAGYPGHIVRLDEDFASFIRDPSGPAPENFPIVASGTVIRKQSEESGVWLYTNAYADAGNSGGPLFDECGRVVGVITLLQSSANPTVEGGRVLGATIGKALALESVREFFAAEGLEAPPVAAAELPGRS